MTIDPLTKPLALQAPPRAYLFSQELVSIGAPSDPTPGDRDLALEHELLEVINRHIRQRSLHPQTASRTLTCMAIDSLCHVAWLPPALREAMAALKRAARHHAAA